MFLESCLPPPFPPALCRRCPHHKRPHLEPCQRPCHRRPHHQDLPQAVVIKGMPKHLNAYTTRATPLAMHGRQCPMSAVAHWLKHFIWQSARIGGVFFPLSPLRSTPSHFPSPSSPSLSHSPSCSSHSPSSHSLAPSTSGGLAGIHMRSSILMPHLPLSSFALLLVFPPFASTLDPVSNE